MDPRAIYLSCILFQFFFLEQTIPLNCGMLKQQNEKEANVGNNHH